MSMKRTDLKGSEKVKVLRYVSVGLDLMTHSLSYLIGYVWAQECSLIRAKRKLIIIVLGTKNICQLGHAVEVFVNACFLRKSNKKYILKINYDESHYFKCYFKISIATI